MVNIGNTWDIILKDEWSMSYYQALRSFLAIEYKTHTIFPPMNDIFNAFKLCPYENVKVVILGQDPYHEINQAHGLAFSVKKGVEIPPSLKNIYKELANDVEFVAPKHGFLESWAKQGVFLLNTTLTVREGHAASHKGHGWETFTDHVISKLNEREDPIVFILWGGNARSKAQLIDKSKHLVLESPHPSPLSAYAGFFGCKHFSKANSFLTAHNKTPIDWNIND